MNTKRKLSSNLGGLTMDEEFKIEDEFEETLREDLAEEACNE